MNKNEKLSYDSPSLELVCLSADDVIVTSGFPGEDDILGPMLPRFTVF